MERGSSLEAGGSALHVAYNGILIPLRGLFPLYALAARARGAERREIRERLGFIDRATIAGLTAPVWFHASSMGEVGVAETVMKAIAGARARRDLYLTTTTRTGQARARRGILCGARTGYAPLDFPRAVRRFLEGLRPAALILVETELWPNLITAVHHRGVPILIVNGRISERALRRYRLVRPLMRRVLESLALVCVQSAADADRFVALGLPEDRTRVTGNIKFAQAAPRSEGGGLLRSLGVLEDDEVWLAGSTAEGEEEIVIDALRALPPPAHGRRLLVIAPRRPERFGEVATILDRSGIPWRRRSAGPGPAAPGASPDETTPGGPLAEGPGLRALLLDSMGELPALYGGAAVAFVGGTLAPVGGHNIIEPAARGVAPVFGPHIENIRDVAGRLLEVGGAFQASDRASLTSLFARLAADSAARRSAGEIASRVVAENRNSLEATLREVLPLIEGGRGADA